MPDDLTDKRALVTGAAGRIGLAVALRLAAGGARVALVATVRLVREAGWANAMRFMLTGDHWSAEEALRMGVVQEIAPTAEEALQLRGKQV
jgi:enoyl-CoA hydratase/carnithine racemase